jgi:uracil-DNA glycosylase
MYSYVNPAEFSDSCLPFFRNPLDIIGPEVDAMLGLIIWNFTLRQKKATIGKSSFALVL